MSQFIPCKTTPHKCVFVNYFLHISNQLKNILGPNMTSVYWRKQVHSINGVKYTNIRTTVLSAINIHSIIIISVGRRKVLFSISKICKTLFRKDGYWSSRLDWYRKLILSMDPWDIVAYNVIEDSTPQSHSFQSRMMNYTISSINEIAYRLQVTTESDLEEMNLCTLWT